MLQGVRYVWMALLKSVWGLKNKLLLLFAILNLLEVSSSKMRGL